MSKYDALSDRLAGADTELRLSFDEVSELVGGLPPSAYHRREWWANNDQRHVQARAWLGAGMRVESVDFGRRHVVFCS